MLRIILLVLLASSAYGGPLPLLIGAFNIQIFGQSKMDKPQVVDILVKIVQRYDIVMIQEIRDAAETALPELVGLTNAAGPNHYDFVVSPRTGRSSSKEQYGYLFRSDRVKVIAEYQYPDNKDVFEREPYTVLFERTTVDGYQRTFSYMSLHAKPDDAVAEIDYLDDVYDILAWKKDYPDALIAGDFNADCSYVCASCWDEIDMWNESRFSWLTPHSADTTVNTNTNCAYDRLVVVGDEMTLNSSPGTVFRYDTEYNLSYEEAKDVSDHYPVEFNLY